MLEHVLGDREEAEVAQERREHQRLVVVLVELEHVGERARERGELRRLPLELDVLRGQRLEQHLHGALVRVREIHPQVTGVQRRAGVVADREQEVVVDVADPPGRFAHTTTPWKRSRR